MLLRVSRKKIVLVRSSTWGASLLDKLRGEQRCDVFCARITELVAVAFSRLSSPFGGGLDVINVVDLVHEEAFGLHDDRDRLERSDIFQSHRHRAGNRFAHHHVDLGLAREKTQHLADIVALKFTNADAAAFRNAVGSRTGEQSWWRACVVDGWGGRRVNRSRRGRQ